MSTMGGEDLDSDAETLSIKYIDRSLDSGRKGSIICPFDSPTLSHVEEEKGEEMCMEDCHISLKNLESINEKYEW